MLMNLLKVIIRNIEGNGFRSWVVFFCADLMAGFLIAITLVIGGAQESLHLAIQRLGADIIVVPQGSEAKMENAFLMGAPARMWMPEEIASTLQGIPGVEQVSPQLFLSTLRGATCCTVPDMFLVAYDPHTDFTLKPWLTEHLENGLHLGEAVGGYFVYLPADQEFIEVYGTDIDLVGNLASTGTGIDQSMFFTFDTALAIAESSASKAERPLEIPSGNISAAMVKIRQDSDPHQVAEAIRQTIPGVTPVESTNLFRSQQTYLVGLLRSVALITGILWVLSLVLIGLVFSMALNERQREIGVLRALGSTRLTILRSLLGEGLLVALPGAASGILLFTVAVYLFRHAIIQYLRTPFILPTPLELAGLALGGLLLVLASVGLAALVPALRISLMDPAVAMRE
jgi:putative ABC transport system permease protein